MLLLFIKSKVNRNAQNPAPTITLLPYGRLIVKLGGWKAGKKIAVKRSGKECGGKVSDKC